MVNLASIRKRTDRMLADYRHAVRVTREERERLAAARVLVAETTEAQKILQEVAEKIQQIAHRQLASVVTRCLQTVFGEDAYEFRIDFRKIRGKTDADLTFVKDGHDVDPMDASGGGSVDVASFALRLACIMLTQPARRRLLVSDEPFRCLSPVYRPIMAEVVMELARELDFQIILVTHSPEFCVGKVVEIK